MSLLKEKSHVKFWRTRNVRLPSNSSMKKEVKNVALKNSSIYSENFAKSKGSNQRFLPQNGKKSPEFQRFLWPQLLENLKVFTYDERSYTKVAVLFALHHTVALNCYRLFGEFRKQRQYQQQFPTLQTKPVCLR